MQHLFIYNNYLVEASDRGQGVAHQAGVWQISHGTPLNHPHSSQVESPLPSSLPPPAHSSQVVPDIWGKFIDSRYISALYKLSINGPWRFSSAIRPNLPGHDMTFSLHGKLDPCKLGHRAWFSSKFIIQISFLTLFRPQNRGLVFFYFFLHPSLICCCSCCSIIWLNGSVWSECPHCRMQISAHWSIKQISSTGFFSSTTLELICTRRSRYKWKCSQFCLCTLHCWLATRTWWVLQQQQQQCFKESAQGCIM